MDCMLTIRNPDLSRVGAIKNPIMTWTRRWHEAGEFELELPFRGDIEYDTILSRRCGELTDPREAGVVRGYLPVADDKNGDKLTVTGYLLAGYATQRIVWGTQTITGSPEDVMKELAYLNMGAGAASERRFANFSVDVDRGLSGASINYQSTDEKLSDELDQLSKDSGLGYDVVIQNDVMLFRVLEGLDRTSGQSVNPKAIFTIERKNLLTAEFEKDGTKYTNVARITTELYTEVFGTATGYQRYETAVKASGVEKDENGTANSEATQRSLMRQQGEQKLTPMTLRFTCRVDPDGNLKYKQHYDLGDIVTCGVKRWGVSIDARITEIKEIFTVGGFGLEVTFGTGLLTEGKTIRRIANG